VAVQLDLDQYDPETFKYVVSEPTRIATAVNTAFPNIINFIKCITDIL
jgi:hypothetical protein